MKKLILIIATLFVAMTACFWVGCTTAEEPVITIQTGNKTYKDYKIPPIITVDFAGYSQTDIPDAVKGADYKIFTASAHDIYQRDINVYTEIYLYYYSENRSLVNVSDGYFTPTDYGVYTIQYSAEDLFGNVNTLTVDVECGEVNDLSATLESGYADSGTIGQEIAIADIEVANAIGNLNVGIQAKLKNGNVIYELTGKSSFVPEYAGEYEIIYTFADYSRCDEIKYDLTVASGNVPVIGGIAVPEYFIAGVSYDLPMPDKCYYSVDGKKFDIVPKISVKDSGDPDPIEISGKFVPTTQGKIEIYYIAEYNGLINQVKYESTVVEVGLFGELQMENYFQGENIVSKATNDDVIITAPADATFDFIREVPSQSVKLIFGVDNINNKFNRFDIYLTDAADATNRVKFSFVKIAQGGRFYVNDDEYSNTEANFESLMRTEFNYNGGTQTATLGGSGAIEVLTTVDGEKFNGFSDTVNIEMYIGGVTGYSSVHIFQINNQSFYNEYGDGVAPLVIFNSYAGGSVKVGDVVNLDRIFVGDVLDPVYTVTYYVKAPDGSFVTDLNGTPIDTNYDYTKPQSFIATQTGSYVVYISVSDSALNEEIYAYGFKVSGKDAVTLSLESGGTTSVSAGQTIKLKTATVNLLDDSVKYEIFVYVLCPDMIMDYVANGNGAVYRPDLKGEYKVFYLVSDSNGEVVTASYTFTVK